MITTPGAISMLIAGAHVADMDVTSVDLDGKQYFAALRQCEDDSQLRKCLDIDEFQPVVEIVSRTWHGNYGKFPNIRFVVTDGVKEMTEGVNLPYRSLPRTVPSTADMVTRLLFKIYFHSM
jgi:hypothetical protein